jgi:outer membrane protein assembly factor BamD
MRYGFNKVSGSVLMLWVGLSISAGCGGRSDSDSVLDYSANAERRFLEAMDEFDDEDCTEAQPMFLDIRSEFPYSRYAKLAELRIADCKFILGNHAEAAVAYRHFVKTHPTHEDAPYAAFRRGLCYYEMIPGDYIVTPPPHERDQAATRDARVAFSGFLRTYPETPWSARAAELLSEVEDALVQHEIYVAGFYLSRDDRRAAVVRLEGVREHFPESNLVPEAMLMQATVFLEMDDIAEARRVFQDIVTHFPGHHEGRRAEDYLEHLDAKHGSQKRGGNG